MGKRIGELLLEYDLVSQKQLNEAVKEQKRTGAKLGDVIIRRGLVTAEDLEYILSRQFATPSLNLKQYNPTPEVLSIIPEWYVRKNLVVPVEIHGKTLTVAMTDPRDFRILDELSFMTGKRLSPVVSSVYNLKESINALFGEPRDGIEEEENEGFFAQGKKLETKDGGLASLPPSLGEVFSSLGSLPQADFFLHLLECVNEQAITNLHFFKSRNKVEIKPRINGRFEGKLSPPVHPTMDFLQHLKVRAGITVRENEPFEGAFREKSSNTWYRVTLSGMPNQEGEHIALEFSQVDAGSDLTLDQLGFTSEMLSSYRNALSKKRGLILYVAPMLSGLTTTIYASLNEIKEKVGLTMTYEAPVKMKLDEVLQIDSTRTLHLDPVDGLRILLSQNADCLMISDISTPEAMRAATHAALDGTLVLARAKDPDPIAFLSKMAHTGISPAIMASSISGVMAQRLVDRLCPDCAKPYEPVHTIREEIKSLTGKMQPKLSRASGCTSCEMTGVAGKVGIFEFIPGGKTLQKLIMELTSTMNVEDMLRASGHKSLLQDGVVKATEGLVSYEQVSSEI